jgi:uncharacterized membrane protein|nr:MAG TPA: hypothetical protein [Caudoviricetes sp.]
MDSKKYFKLIILMIIVIIVLIIDIFFSIKQEIDYQQRKESGNNRWLHIEERILKTEEEIQAVKEKLQ